MGRLEAFQPKRPASGVFRMVDTAFKGIVLQMACSARHQAVGIGSS